MTSFPFNQREYRSKAMTNDKQQQRDGLLHPRPVARQASGCYCCQRHWKLENNPGKLTILAKIDWETWDNIRTEGEVRPSRFPLRINSIEYIEAGKPRKSKNIHNYVLGYNSYKKLYTKTPKNLTHLTGKLRTSRFRKIFSFLKKKTRR